MIKIQRCLASKQAWQTSVPSGHPMTLPPCMPHSLHTVAALSSSASSNSFFKTPQPGIVPRLGNPLLAGLGEQPPDAFIGIQWGDRP